MEIKTTWDIIEWFENKEYKIASTEYGKDKHKRWVALDDIMKVDNNLTIQELKLLILAFPCIAWQGTARN